MTRLSIYTPTNRSGRIQLLTYRDCKRGSKLDYPWGGVDEAYTLKRSTQERNTPSRKDLRIGWVVGGGGEGWEDFFHSTAKQDPNSLTQWLLALKGVTYFLPNHSNFKFTEHLILRNKIQLLRSHSMYRV